MKSYKNILKTVFFTSILSLSPLTINSYAGNNITIDPIFPTEHNYWYPGKIESKDFYIHNNKDDDIQIDRLYIHLKSCRNSRTGKVLDVNSKFFKELAKNSNVTLTSNGKVLVKSTFENLLSSRGAILSKKLNVKANGKKLLNMTIGMDEKMNNDAQSLDSVFTFSVAYKVDSGKSHNKHGHGGIVKPDSTDENDDIVKPDIIDENNDIVKSDITDENDDIVKPDITDENDDIAKPDITDENDDIVKPDTTVKNDDIVKPNDGDRHNNIKNSYHRVENNNIINSNSEIGSNNANKSNVDIGKNEVNKLPQTGGIVNSYSLIGLGVVSIGTGIVLNRKSSKKNGGK